MYSYFIFSGTKSYSRTMCELAISMLACCLQMVSKMVNVQADIQTLYMASVCLSMNCLNNIFEGSHLLNQC